MRVVVQGMDIIDVLYNAIYYVLKWKMFKLFINMEIIKKLWYFHSMDK